MPFTLSHAAAVLPFTRPLARWRLLSATVIGSMVPDFGLFSPVRPARFETHGAMSLLTFSLPVGLAVYWVFQRLVRTPVIEVLPDRAYARWLPVAAPADLGRLLQWIMAACGVLMGAVTHLVWDGFTHEGARGIRMIPALDDPVEIAGHHLMGARLLQDASSLIGLVVVLVVFGYGLRTRRGDAAAPPRRLCAAERRLWVLAYLSVAVLTSLIFFALKYPGSSSAHGFAVRLGGLAIASMRGLALSLLSVSLCLSLRLRALP